ncbi:YidC/Oxa1 family membrane protein insertase [Tangfeifania diversioriginum]|uniref:Membrane protein insertase YidC n=1 Tax=Tangfeifania diversioriginum TaxID=1168035 RepID=A0A1M6D4B6_9BACT|nr:membrane protein insertase YidC [Tangfeifania diversioriginum]SHI67933.1 YidC/Oxa1 family membrane protein insertase [Tangfeifania diversioriginum]
MDKNSIIGIILIFGILIVFSIMNQPSEEDIEAAKRRRDSIAQVEAEKKALEQQQAEQQSEETLSETVLPDTINADAELQQKIDEFGVFGKAAIGDQEFYTIENNLLKITLTNKGGRIYSVELKDYQTHDSLPLILFDGDETQFGLSFFAQNRSIQTDQLFFEPSFTQQSLVVSGPEVSTGNEGRLKFNNENPGEEKSAVFRLEVAPDRYMEYVYTLKHNSFMIDFDVNLQGMEQYIAANQSYLNFTWSFDVPRQERPSRFGEDRYTNINYKFFEDDVDELSKNKSDEEDLTTRVKWIGFKQLFFNSTIIAEDAFPNAFVRSDKYEENPEYLANFHADIAFPYQGATSESMDMQIYFGPNHYQTLKQYDLDLERLVYLGYAIVRPVNKYIIIPIFNFLRKYISNFGIIILVLTVLIKTVLFPFTYKSYVSQAKMRALKPEIDDINKKIPKDKAMERQQATMNLYKKAGVNPMGGCLPMLLQFPILIAMFFFYPNSIELRQESFLWAHDLSTYDSILNLPFEIPFYGDHVSLFCLLMTVTTIISTKLNQQATTSQGMPGMKTMMYMMPVMFLFILNNYSSGLSYYYFLANVITIGQTYIIRSTIDESKIRAQLQVNKKKPVKKSKFQKRLEEVAKQKGMQPPKK